MSRKYKFQDQERLYFISTAIIEWIDVFTRPVYKDIVIESLKYCQQHKDLDIYAYCLMTNHLPSCRWIASSANYMLAS